MIGDGRVRLVIEHAGQTRAADLDTSELEDAGAVDERLSIGFHISDAEPATEYRLVIGTEPAGGDEESALGVAVGATVQWPAEPYFESARGRTPIRVESRRGAEHWRARGGFVVQVVPSKLGEAGYRTLYEELRSISPILVRDVHGKSLRSATLHEGEAIAAAWARTERALAVLPASTPLEPFARRLEARHGAARAIALAGANAAAPPHMPLLACALDELMQRVGRIAAGAAHAIADVDAERQSTDIAVRGRSIYQIVDAPRRDRLAALESAMRTLHDRILAARSRPPLAGVSSSRAPARSLPPAGPLRAALGAMRAALVAAREAEVGGAYVKPTSRLYEEWVFLRLARVIAESSRDAASLDALLDRIRTRRFGGGVPRDATVRFELFDDRTAVLRFEPWIRPRPDARARGDELCREDVAAAPLTPDVLLEFRMAGAITEVVVIDAKYTVNLTPKIWRGAERYFALRFTETGRRVDVAVWIAAPVAPEQGSRRAADMRPPDSWRGGYLPLVPGTDLPGMLVPGDGAPIAAEQSRPDRGAFATQSRAAVPGSGSPEHGRRVARDGASINLRAFIRFVLAGG